MEQVTHILREYRHQSGKTLAALADELSTSKTTLSEIENGKRPVSLGLLPKLASVTGIPAHKLRPDLAAQFRRGAA